MKQLHEFEINSAIALMDTGTRPTIEIESNIGILVVTFPTGWSPASNRYQFNVSFETEVLHVTEADRFNVTLVGTVLFSSKDLTTYEVLESSYRYCGIELKVKSKFKLKVRAEIKRVITTEFGISAEKAIEIERYYLASIIDAENRAINFAQSQLDRLAKKTQVSYANLTEFGVRNGLLKG